MSVIFKTADQMLRCCELLLKSFAPINGFCLLPKHVLLRFWRERKRKYMKWDKNEHCAVDEQLQATGRSSALMSKNWASRRERRQFQRFLESPIRRAHIFIVAKWRKTEAFFSAQFQEKMFCLSSESVPDTKPDKTGTRRNISLKPQDWLWSPWTVFGSRSLA